MNAITQTEARAVNTAASSAANVLLSLIHI